MARPKPKPKPKPKQKAAATPAVTRAEPPPPAEVAPASPAERAPRRDLVIAGVVVAACAAATALLLSGWTPGPKLPTPPRSAARATAIKKPAPPQPRKVAPKKRAPKRATTPPPKPLSAAAELFAGQCGFCHTLAAAGTTGRVGPNLDQLRPSRQRVLDAIAAGGRRTGLMPPDIVSGADAQQVARYVARVTHR